MEFRNCRRSGRGIRTGAVVRRRTRGGETVTDQGIGIQTGIEPTHKLLGHMHKRIHLLFIDYILHCAGHIDCMLRPCIWYAFDYALSSRYPSPMPTLAP
jgi:hypothetical protein